MKDPRTDPIISQLHVSPEFVAADAALLFSICNGCGAKGAKVKVPKTMWFLSILICCFIHDWDWHHAKTWGDKIAADRRFLLNLLIIIEQRSQNALMRFLRSERAIKYYCAVRDFGEDAFWAGKPRPAVETPLPAPEEHF